MVAPDMGVAPTAASRHAVAARRLTDEVKADAQALWTKLLTLYEGKAHEALGYTSWGDYFRTEFGGEGTKGYRLLYAAEVMGHLPIGKPVPRNESVARELAPLRAEPVVLREAWAETVDRHGPAPTAAQTAEVVRERLPGPRTAFAQARETGGAVLDSTGHWQTGRDPAADGGTHWVRITHWAEHLDSMPEPEDIVVPSFGAKAFPAAERVADYLTRFLEANRSTT